MQMALQYFILSAWIALVTNIMDTAGMLRRQRKFLIEILSLNIR